MINTSRDKGQIHGPRRVTRAGDSVTSTGRDHNTSRYYRLPAKTARCCVTAQTPDPCRPHRPSLDGRQLELYLTKYRSHFGMCACLSGTLINAPVWQPFSGLGLSRLSRPGRQIPPRHTGKAGPLLAQGPAAEDKSTPFFSQPVMNVARHLESGPGRKYHIRRSGRRHKRPTDLLLRPRPFFRP